MVVLSILVGALSICGKGLGREYIRLKRRSQWTRKYANAPAAARSNTKTASKTTSPPEFIARYTAAGSFCNNSLQVVSSGTQKPAAVRSQNDVVFYSETDTPFGNVNTRFNSKAVSAGENAVARTDVMNVKS